MAMHEKPMMLIRSGRRGMFLVSAETGLCLGRVVAMLTASDDPPKPMRIEIEVGRGAIATGPDLDAPETT